MKCIFVCLVFAQVGSHFAAIEQTHENLAKLLTEIKMRDETGNYTVEYLVESNGYPIETHKVHTSDGYILTMHRIPYGLTGVTLGKAAFVQHGLLSSSADFCVLGAGKSLAFKLADAGYDVWMGNARGNTWSREHETLSPNESAFWNFSWHETGMIDVPNMIDYVLGNTSLTQVRLRLRNSLPINFLGTTVYYVMTSSLPEYRSKTKVGINIAPIGFLDHMISPVFNFLSTFTGPPEALANLIGQDEFLPTSDFFKYFIGDELCQQDSVSQLLCTNILFLICGFSRDQMNTTLLPTILKYTPAGTSTKNVYHYSQEVKSGYFRQYDYGALNFLKYGQLFPPDYEVSKISTPTIFFWSESDWLSVEIDVNRLCVAMGSSCVQQILVENFNHIDFLFGNDAHLVNDQVIDVLSKY